MRRILLIAAVAFAAIGPAGATPPPAATSGATDAAANRASPTTSGAAGSSGGLSGSTNTPDQSGEAARGVTPAQSGMTR